MLHIYIEKEDSNTVGFFFSYLYNPIID